MTGAGLAHRQAPRPGPVRENGPSRTVGRSAPALPALLVAGRRATGPRCRFVRARADVALSAVKQCGTPPQVGLRAARALGTLRGGAGSGARGACRTRWSGEAR